MKYNELQAIPNKNRKRSGRGEAAGRGKTAGRGHKGQNARSGGKRRPGFEGGQTPLVQRIPKVRGFRSIKSPVATITTDQLQNMKSKKPITKQVLADEGVLSKKFEGFKVVLGKEELKVKIDVSARAASKNAIAAIEKAGGKFTRVTVSEEKTNKKAKD